MRIAQLLPIVFDQMRRLHAWNYQLSEIYPNRNLNTEGAYVWSGIDRYELQWTREMDHEPEGAKIQFVQQMLLQADTHFLRLAAQALPPPIPPPVRRAGWNPDPVPLPFVEEEENPEWNVVHDV